MDAAAQEAIISAILAIVFIYFWNKWIQHTKKLDAQFEEDATGMVVKSIRLGKVQVLQDLKNGFVIVDKCSRPILKKFVRPIYF